VSDRERRDAENAWRARRDDESLSRALVAYEREGRDLPWELLAASPRWRRHVGFVKKWFAKPLEPADGVAAEAIEARERKLALRLPRAVREWFLLAGARVELTGEQDFIIDLDRLELEDGNLPLIVENQAVCTWGIPSDELSVDDPTTRVFSAYEGEEVRRTEPFGSTVTDLYLAYLFHELPMGRNFGNWVATLVYYPRRTKAWLAAAKSAYQVIPLRSLSSNKVDILADADTIIGVLYAFGGYCVFARTAAARAKAVAAFGAPARELTGDYRFHHLVD